MNDAELARNYILDRLPDEDRDVCERRFLFDPEFESIMLEQERILLDDYVHNRISKEDADAVLVRVAQQPGHLYRLRFAESLKRAAALENRPAPSAAPAPKRPLGRQLFWLGGLAAAALLVLAIGLVTRLQHREPQSASTQPATHSPEQIAPQPASNSAPQPPSAQASATTGMKPAGRPAPMAASSATFVLLANQQRGEDDMPVISLPPGANAIELQLTTEEGLDAGRYAATLIDVQGRRIYSAGNLATRTQSGRRYIDLRLDAASLSSGIYSIDLAGSPHTPAIPALTYRFNLVAGHPGKAAQQ